MSNTWDHAFDAVYAFNTEGDGAFRVRLSAVHKIFMDELLMFMIFFTFPVCKVFEKVKCPLGNHLNDSSEERRHDKNVLPPDEEGGVGVEGEPVQPRHQVQVPHLERATFLACRLGCGDNDIL